MIENKFSWGTIGIAAVAILAITAAVWLWLHPQIKTVNSVEYKQIAVEKPVEKLVKVPVPVYQVLAYDKKAIADTLPLPTETTANPDKQVIANAEIEHGNDDGKTSAVAVLDTKTGETTILAKELPPPFFAFENHGQIGGFYGYNDRLLPTVQIQAQWKFMRIMNIHGAIQARGSNDGGFIGVGALYEW